MIAEFVIWLILSTSVSSILEYTTSLRTVFCLLIGAFSAAILLCIIDIFRNRRFRAHAIQTEANVEHILPPLRINGPSRVQVSCMINGKSVLYIFSPNSTPQIGDKIPVWTLGRRILSKKPTYLDDFRILIFCSAAVLVLGIAFLCTKLLPALRDTSTGACIPFRLSAAFRMDMFPCNHL